MKIIRKIVHSLIYKIFGGDILNEFIYIRKYYHLSLREKKPSPMIVYCMDGKDFTSGFADRLRGIVSSYAFAKANELQFKLNHNVPFKMEKYFEPNSIDWRISDNELSYNLLYANPVFMIDYASGRRFFYIIKKRQHHIYSNIDAIKLINKHYNKSYNYSDLFKELFKPSNIIIDQIEHYRKFLDEGYISISFRFMQLLGDFKDVRGAILHESEQKELISKCIFFINKIRNQHLDIPYILVTSDSTKFMLEVKKINYVFTISGKIGHIGFISDDDVQLKTMLDFYMISQAKKAYLGYTKDMYKSNFAKVAALTTNIPFEKIQID